MSKKQHQKSKQKKYLFFILKILGLSFLLLFFGLSALFVYYAKGLPRPEKFLEKPFVLPTRIYDRTGETLLYKIYGDEIRIIVPLEKIPLHLQQAVIATEDRRFLEHSGVDFRGITRALWVNIREGRIVEGGSTISQQLIRTSFLTGERTLERKVRETVLTLELERRYSKEQILEWYLNQIPFGIAHGVEAASQVFFNEPVSEISLPEAAILTALIKAPTRLSPFGPNRDELLFRKRHVLNRMVIAGFITEEEAKIAKETELKFADGRHQKIKAPHFVLYIKKHLTAKYGEERLREKGLTVITSLDWELQQLAEKAIEERIGINKTRHNAHNAALVALNPETGHILALVGSAGWFKNPYPENCRPGIDCLFDPKFDAAINTGRQPGSAFKTFIYAVAFEKGYDDETIVYDKETNFGIWGGRPYIPQNFDRRFRGPVTLRQALAQSLNVPSVKVLNDLIGLENPNLIEFIENVGITAPKKPLKPSLALGVSEVNLLDMVSAHGVFATEGYRIPPISILRIKDAQRNIIEENKKAQKRVLSSQTSRLINSILSDEEARAPIFGRRSTLYFENQKIAVKTGTTDDLRDGWTIGHTSSLVVGVWAGNSDNSPTRRPGVTLAAPIWRTFVEGAIKYF